MEVLSLVDYRKYQKFKILTPVAHRLSSGDYHLQIMEIEIGTKKLQFSN